MESVRQTRANWATRRTQRRLLRFRLRTRKRSQLYKPARAISPCSCTHNSRNWTRWTSIDSTWKSRSRCCGSSVQTNFHPFYVRSMAEFKLKKCLQTTPACRMKRVNNPSQKVYQAASQNKQTPTNEQRPVKSINLATCRSVTRNLDIHSLRKE